MRFARVLFALALFILTYFPFYYISQARDYVPVDNLGKGSSAPRPKVGAASAGNSSPRRAPAHGGGGRTYVTESGATKLFGTVEFMRPLNTLPGWLDVLRRNQAEPIYQPERFFNKSTTWNSMRQAASGKSDMEKLRYVNSFWNAWPYREDSSNWGKQDYWEIPAQFLKKSGDCEDYAIIKYFTLKELGFDPQKMRIVVLRDTVRNLAHAVLAVYMPDDVYVLDNLSNVVLSHKRLGNYTPQYSINEHGRWTHIISRKK